MALATLLQRKEARTLPLLGMLLPYTTQALSSRQSEGSTALYGQHPDRRAGQSTVGFPKSRGPTRWDCYSPPQGGPGCIPYSEITQGPHEVGLRAVGSFAESGTGKVQWCLAEPSAGGDTEVSTIYPSKIWGQTLPEFCH